MKLKVLILGLFFPLIFTACESEDYIYIDDTPPSPPTGIIVLNGDSRVDLSWNPNPESDVAGYNVFYAYSYKGKYTLIGSTRNNYFVDNGAVNGTTYYYAVTAYDYNGNESELSYDVVYTTPRPEGFNRVIYDYRSYPETSGYYFAGYSVLPFDSDLTDFFFENYNGTYYLNVWDDSDIQDKGSTIDIYDIPYAPVTGWSPSKDAAAIIGHTYVIWTWDNHYAKIRIKNITPERIVFDWAYQLVEGNRILKRGSSSVERAPIDKSKLKKR